MRSCPYCKKSCDDAESICPGCSQVLEAPPVRRAPAKSVPPVSEARQLIGSTVAEKVLSQWDSILPQFVKVMPTDYKRFLEEQEREQEIEAA